MADYLRKYKSLYSSTANSFSTGTGATITPASVVGLPTDTEITLTFDRVSLGGTETPSLLERIIGTISGSSFVVRSSPSSGRGADSTTEQAHTSPVVEMIWNAKDWNDLITHLLVEHNQDGTHKSPVVTATNTVTLTNKTLTAPKFADLGFIADANGNELLVLDTVTSAVNEAKLANAATGNSPEIAMQGGDSNVGLDLKMKGSGRFRKPTVVGIQAVGVATDTSTGDGKAFFRVPAELNGMNLTGVNASVATAGTTNTTDVQIRRNRSGSDADMLSTKITIDSTETDTSTAATPAVINTSNDDVATGDRIFIDIDAVSTTAAKGLYIELRFELP